jgi:HSP20 family protein
MTVDPAQKRRNTWLYGVIAFLLFLLVFETGLLLNRQWSKSKGSELHPTVSHEPYSPRTSAFPSSLFRRSISGTEEEPFGSDPLQELEKLRTRMNRLFNTALTYGPPLAHSLSGGAFSDFIPAIDLEETDKAYIVRGDLPGLEKDKINVTVRGNLVTIQGIRQTQSEKQDEQGGFYAQERSYGSFARTLTLPGPVDESRVLAEYRDGVLTITLPKLGETKTTQKVAIQ